MTWVTAAIEISLTGKIEGTVDVERERALALVARGATAVLSMTEDENARWDLWLAWTQGDGELEEDELVCSFDFFDHGRHFARTLARALEDQFPGIDVQVPIEPRENEWQWDLVGYRTTWSETEGGTDATAGYSGQPAGP